jgi:hypothetical protein
MPRFALSPTIREIATLEKAPKTADPGVIINADSEQNCVRFVGCCKAMNKLSDVRVGIRE